MGGAHAGDDHTVRGHLSGGRNCLTHDDACRHQQALPYLAQEQEQVVRGTFQLPLLFLTLGVLRGNPGSEADTHGLVVSGGLANFSVGRDGDCIHVVRADLHGHRGHGNTGRALTQQQQPKV